MEIETLEDGSQIWIYTSANGDVAPYVNGYVKFPNKYLNPDIPYINIGGFTGDRSKDKILALQVLEEDYGITEVPEGYVLHHDAENGIIQLVRSDIHEEFTHIGGHSMHKGD